MRPLMISSWSYRQPQTPGISEKVTFTYQKLHVTKFDNTFVKQMDTHAYADRYAIKLITLEGYNRMENTQ